MPQILMPALSPTMEEGKLSKWLVKVGDTVKSGDVLAEIETDKATMEVESVDEGVVKDLLVAEGTEGVKVNTPIALVLAEGETAEAAPAGENLAGFMPLGWWKFSQLEAKAGPAAAQQLNIYKRSVIAFIAFLLLGLILSGWVSNQTPAPATASAEPRLINDPRVIPAQFAFNTDLRRVATMPGAQEILES